MALTKKTEKVLWSDQCPVPHAIRIPLCGLCRAGIDPVSHPRDHHNPNTCPIIINDHPVPLGSRHHHQGNDARHHRSHRFSQQNMHHQIFQTDDKEHHLRVMAHKLAHLKDHLLLTINVSILNVKKGSNS